MKRLKDEIELIVALATGNSIREAARLAGFSERTAGRRNADDDFRNRIVRLVMNCGAQRSGS